MTEECPVVHFSRDRSSALIDTLKQQNVYAVDKPGETIPSHFSTFYVICIALSIVTYVFDLALAGLLLYYYSLSLGEHGVHFALTLTFVVVPALLTTAFNLRWYIVDHDDPAANKISLTQWIIRIIFLLLQISPLLRYVDALVFGIKSKLLRTDRVDNSWQLTLYRRMLDEDTNGALLRLFHCFLHAAPQAVIQLMFLLDSIAHSEKRKLLDVDIAVVQSLTVFSALISIAWSLTSYHRSVRFSRDDKINVSCSGTLVAFCWHLMSAVSRVLALSLLASVFPIWMGCVCAIHWGMMSIWLALGQHQTAACSSRCEELLLSVALGLAYVLAFISPRDGPTRYVYLAYYLVCFMENTAALVVWCVANNSVENPFLYYGAAGAQMIAFLLAIMFLLIYYRHCHPCTASRTRVPKTSFDLNKPTYSKS